MNHNEFMDFLDAVIKGSGLPEERIEAQIWARFLARHTNMALRGASFFLIEFYDLEVDTTAWEEPLRTHDLNDVQKEEVRRWHRYFAGHSHPGLNELASWLPQWYDWLDSEPRVS